MRSIIFAFLHRAFSHRRWLSHRLGIVFLCFLAVVPGASSWAQAEGQDSKAGCSRLEVYYSTGCPHCTHALDYLDELRTRVPELDIRTYEVTESRETTERFIELSRRFGVDRPSVPVFYGCDAFLVGFGSAETTGREIERMLDLAPALLASEHPAPGSPVSEQSVSERSASEPPASLNEQSIETDRFGVLSADRLGLPLFTIAIGLIDGFNPCAMWVLLFLLSLLVNLRDRRRMALIAGMFVAISGLVYFAFMAAWLNVFLLIGYSRMFQLALGILAIGVAIIHAKDFFAFHRGPSLSIPESAKPGLYRRMRSVVSAENLTGSLVAIAVVAVLVNLVELLCTAGLPAMYTQILSLRELSVPSYYGYLVLYNLAYIFDDSIMVGIAVVTLSHRKLQEKQGRWLKLLSAIVIGLLGSLMVFAPELLR